MVLNFQNHNPTSFEVIVKTIAFPTKIISNTYVFFLTIS